MSRINIPIVEQSPAASRPLLAVVNRQLGVVPNLMRLLGNSPAALEGYLSLSGALGKDSLGAGLREQIAIAVAELNGCDYCLSAHAYLAANVAKLGATEIEDARNAHATDPRSAAALRFARNVVHTRGHVADADIAALRDGGFDDAAAVEIVSNVALNLLTNYVNSVARTEVDFPLVRAGAAQSPAE